jgi:hypothetical protein
VSSPLTEVTGSEARQGHGSALDALIAFYSAYMLAGPASMRVTFRDFTSTGGPDFHLVVGRERGARNVPGTTLELRIGATRWFRQQGGIRLQLHHYGSIDEPAPLADYRNTILGHG